MVNEDRDAAERMLDNLLLRLVALTAPAEDYRPRGRRAAAAEGWGLLHDVPTRWAVRRRAAPGGRGPAGRAAGRTETRGTPDEIVERLRGFREAARARLFLQRTGLGDMTKAVGSTALLRDIMHGLRRLP